MKSNQTMMAIGAVVAIILAIGVLVYFLKPAPQLKLRPGTTTFDNQK